MRMILALSSAAVLAACAGTAEPAPPPTADNGAADQCRASAYERYIGRPRSELPRPPAGETWRVLCSTCPATMDYNPSRLNIVFDRQSEIITRVSCG